MRPEPVEGARFDKLSEHYTGGTPWRRVVMRPEPVEGPALRQAQRALHRRYAVAAGGEVSVFGGCGRKARGQFAAYLTGLHDRVDD